MAVGTDKARRILSFVWDNPGASAGAVAKATKINGLRTRFLLRGLVRRGHLDTVDEAPPAYYPPGSKELEAARGAPAFEDPAYR